MNVLIVDDHALFRDATGMLIQDAFNEQGVQILSPHYLDKAEEPVVVPKEGWRPPPTDPESA